MAEAENKRLRERNRELLSLLRDLWGQYNGGCADLQFKTEEVEERVRAALSQVEG